MSSPPRIREREASRRLSLRTLAIASIASATAAIVVSQFWAGGTPIAAAITPVIVTLVSEMLHRPTEAIARRITSERPAILPEAGAAAPPADPAADRLPEHAVSEPGSEREAPVRVYGKQPRRMRRQKIAVGAVVTTAVLAFAIAAAALTVPELITGNSIGKGDRHTTLFGGRKSNKKNEQQPTTPTTTTPSQQSTQTTPQEKKPQATTPTPTTTETTPTQTQTTPKSPSK
jgi:hypothetical protein